MISALPLRSWPDAPVADAPAVSPQGCRALPPGPAAPDGPAPAPADWVSHGRASVGPCTVRHWTLVMCITPLQPISNRSLPTGSKIPMRWLAKQTPFLQLPQTTSLSITWLQQQPEVRLFLDQSSCQLAIAVAAYDVQLCLPGPGCLMSHN